MLDDVISKGVGASGKDHYEMKDDLTTRMMTRMLSERVISGRNDGINDRNAGDHKKV